MKRNLLYILLVIIFFFMGMFIVSCKPTVSNPSIKLKGPSPDLIIQVDSVKWKLKRIDFPGDHIFIMVPLNSKVNCYEDLPETISSSDGTIIKIK